MGSMRSSSSGGGGSGGVGGGSTAILSRNLQTAFPSLPLPQTSVIAFYAKRRGLLFLPSLPSFGLNSGGGSGASVRGDV